MERLTNIVRRAVRTRPPESDGNAALVLAVWELQGFPLFDEQRAMIAQLYDPDSITRLARRFDGVRQDNMTRTKE